MGPSVGARGTGEGRRPRTTACSAQARQGAPPPPRTLTATPTPLFRLLDANLNRAREGLRVAEDWARFGLDRRDLVEAFKDLRQQLGRCHRPEYRLAGHSAGDVGAGLGHPAQEQRTHPGQVVAANCARAQEALRVLEEFGRAHDPDLASTAARVRYRLYDLEIQLLASQDRRQRLGQARLYLITAPVPDLLGVVDQSLQAGLKLVQHRSKLSDDLSRYREAVALRDRCADHGALFVVNDRLDLALAVEADGVHLGQGDLPPEAARRLLGPDRLIGRSTHALDQLEAAVAAGADYTGVGPVHATPTKPGRPPVGFGYLEQAVAAAVRPAYAIGGIDLTTIDAVLATGIFGVAVVRAVMEAQDPGATTAALLERLAAHPPQDP